MKTAVWTLLVIVAVLVAAACWLWEMIRDERKQKRKAELEKEPRLCKWCNAELPEDSSKSRLYCGPECGERYREAEARRRSQMTQIGELPFGRLP